MVKAQHIAQTRLNDEEREILRRGSKLKGLPVSAFMRILALEEAKRIIKSEKTQEGESKE